MLTYTGGSQVPEGYATSLDSILNVVVPLLLIGVVVGFVYIKLLKPSGIVDAVKGWFTKKEDGKQGTTKEIVYE